MGYVPDEVKEQALDQLSAGTPEDIKRQEEELERRRLDSLPYVPSEKSEEQDQFENPNGQQPVQANSLHLAGSAQQEQGNGTVDPTEVSESESAA